MCAFAYCQVAAMKGMKFDNPQSASLSKVVADCQSLKYMLVKVKDSTPNATELEQVRSYFERWCKHSVRMLYLLANISGLTCLPVSRRMRY